MPIKESQLYRVLRVSDATLLLDKLGYPSYIDHDSEMVTMPYCYAAV